MDIPLLHTAMELSAAACLFFISWLNITYKVSGRYSTIMAIGTSLAGLADVFHAVLTHLEPSFMVYWEPWSWSITRLILLATFMMVCLCYDGKFECKKKFIVWLLTLPVIASVIVAILNGYSVVDLSWVYAQFDILGLTVYRPLDFILLIGWIIMSFLLHKKAHVLFPPHVYWLFMFQGIALHAIVAFASTHSTDMAFCIAHGLKISEYYTFILIYLMYKNEMDNSDPKDKYHRITHQHFGTH